jgi:beta-glucosidase
MRSPSRARFIVSTLAPMAICLILGSGCADDAPEVAPGLDPEVERRIDRLLPQMTLEEKVRQMHGAGLVVRDGMWFTHGIERLGIPGYQMVDGPRGVHEATGNATAFPVAMARGATWDPDLERRIGEAIGLEVAAKGGNVLLAPTINLLRHPRWGRAQETYGEDVHHLSRFGVAFVEGAQQHVLADVKHYAANSIEDTRFSVDVQIDERTLREQYLPAFHAAVTEANVASVMSAYNLVNGAYASENAPLLRHILKDEWGFHGWVVSDWLLAVRSTAPSALAGLDIEMPAPAHYGEPLVEAVREGEVPMEVIDDAVRRIVRRQFEYKLDDPPARPPAEVVESEAHKQLAREAARKSMVLLENRDGALPLSPAGITSLVVAGALADAVNLGDVGSSDVHPTLTVTPLEGLTARLSGAAVAHVAQADVLGAEEEAAVADADAVVVVVGLTAEDEGENIPARPGGDRVRMGLSPEHVALVQAVAALSDRTIVVLQGGSAITVEEWVDDVEAVVMAWYSGMEGGTALAELLAGDVNFSGKLPVTVPVSEDQLPVFDNESLSVVYDYFHGYRHVDHTGAAPRYPFGFGLSYTTFAYANLAVQSATLGPEDTLVATVEVTNTGAMAGDEVVQLYVGYDGSAVQRAVRDLRGFARVSLTPGETRTVTLEVPVRDLAYWDAGAGAFVVEPLDYTIHVGGSSRALPLETQVSAGP